ETRWDMSYLRGPLTRTQIKSLMEPVKAQAAAAPPAAAAAAASQVVANVTAAPAPAAQTEAKPAAASQRPTLPPGIMQYFIPARGSSAAGSTLVYQPALLGYAEVGYSDSKTIDFSQQLTLLVPITDGPVAVDWGQGSAVELPIEDLEQPPEETAAEFAELPSSASKPKSYESWKKDLATWLYRTQKLDLLESPSLDVASNPGEAERDFRVRLQQQAREQRDAAAEKLRQKYAPRIAALEEKKRRAEQAVEREAEQAKGSKMQTAISFGATLLSSFMGRKAISLSTLGRATSAARGVGRSMKEAQDVTRAEETVEAVNQQLTDLDAQFREETAAIERSIDPQTEQLETVSLKPKKSNITVKLVTLAWAPSWRDAQGQTAPAWE
ncbi:MAG TPA: hypothetical protein VMS31_18780, partial [Pyrinomonadaceae bacterium]|nr:hypothetical protein [Pyrinomonadaceae bacterium]